MWPMRTLRDAAWRYVEVAEAQIALDVADSLEFVCGAAAVAFPRVVNPTTFGT